MHIWISNCIQMFELYSNVRIYIRMLKECAFSTCSWKMASSDDVGKKISQLHQELVNAYRKKLRFLLRRGKGICADSDVTEEGSREQTWQSVMVGGRWIKKGNFCVTIVEQPYSTKEAVLKNLPKFTGKHLWRSLFLMWLQPCSLQLY